MQHPRLIVRLAMIDGSTVYSASASLVHTAPDDVAERLSGSYNTAPKVRGLIVALGHECGIQKHDDVLRLLTSCVRSAQFVYVFGTYSNLPRWRGFDTRGGQVRSLDDAEPLPDALSQINAALVISRAQISSKARGQSG